MARNKRGTQKPVDTREWYDFVGDVADLIPALHVGGMEATRSLLEMLRLDPSTRVLDVGCGVGSTACYIAAQYGAQVQGIDISPIMVTKAQARGRQVGVADKVEFRVADVSALPFDDGAFDVALCESVLTPFPGDPQVALVEMARVVQPAGQVAASEGVLDPATPPELLALFAQHPAIYTAFTAQTLRDLFGQAGLQVLRMMEVRSSDIPTAQSRLGLREMLRFFVHDYPRVALKLLRDPRFRRAHQVDDEVTKRMRPYMGYALIVGQKDNA